VAASKRDETPAASVPIPVERASIPAYVTWMFCIYLLLLPASELMLRWANLAAGGTNITPDRAIFMVINAITLSGFQSIIAVSTYPGSAQLVILVLTLVGIMFTLIAGGLAVTRILGLPYTDRQVIQSAVVATAVFVAVGCIPLIGRYTPLEAAILSASSFGNSGVYFDRVPHYMDWATHLVLLPLALFGGLGLTVLMEIYDSVRTRRPLSHHARVVIATTAGLYLAILVICFLLQAIDRTDEPLATLVGSSSVAAINTRTLGFPLPFAQDFPTTVQWVLILSMIIGGSPGGTAGGVKTTTFVRLWRGVRAALRGEAAGRPFGLAAVWLGTYFLCTIMIFVLLLATVPQVVPERLLFLAVSAMSNVGLSHEAISFVSPGLHVLSAGMLVGRLAPLMILWWMAQSTPPTDLATA
jgi:trk system potassium uptake protein